MGCDLRRDAPGGGGDGDARFKEFAAKRLEAIGAVAAHVQAATAAGRAQSNPNPVRGLLKPAALDDCGAMCAAFLKAQQAGWEAICGL